MKRKEIAFIIGNGEVGSAQSRVLRTAHNVHLLDIHEPPPNHMTVVDVLHVCFPYSEGFIEQVCKYRDAYRPKNLVIHSTVKPGTSRECGAVHSPVIGLHPNLEISLLTFEKFLGGENASQVAAHFMKAGMKVRLFDKSETTEWMKILSTTRYALDIEWTKYVKHLCRIERILFEAYTLWTQNYNDGYAKMNRQEYARPNLIPIEGRIGGHCILPNLDLMPDSEFVQLIKNRNRED